MWWTKNPSRCRARMTSLGLPWVKYSGANAAVVVAEMTHYRYAAVIAGCVPPTITSYTGALSNPGKYREWQRLCDKPFGSEFFGDALIL